MNKQTKNIGTVYIDSSGFDMVRFAFIPFDEQAKILLKTYQLKKRNAQTAEFLKKFLSHAIHGAMDQIAAFAVQTGDGSFAGMRTGIALALGMGFALDVPIYAINPKGVAKRITEASSIDYGAKPNIGISKKKKLKQIQS